MWQNYHFTLFTTRKMRSMVAEFFKETGWARKGLAVRITNQCHEPDGDYFESGESQGQGEELHGIWVEEKLRVELQLGKKVRERSVVVNERDVCCMVICKVWSWLTTAQWHHFVWQVFRQRPVRIPVPHILKTAFIAWHLLVISLTSTILPIKVHLNTLATAWNSPPHPNHSAHHEENHETERPSHTANTISTLQTYHSQNILLLTDDGQAVSMIRIPWSG